MASRDYTIPKTQRQWQQVRRGLPKEALQLVDNVPLPTPGPGEVLVKIAYVATTPGSWKLMRALPGFLRRGGVPEMEASGRVVDPNGSACEKGTEVMCFLSLDEFFKGRGALTEYALFKSDLTFPIPPTMTLQTGSGLLGSAATCWKALVEIGKLQPGQRVFINGGTTAVGMLGIQMAKILGAGEIVVSCSEASFRLVKELGADRAIDYKASPLPTQLSALFSSNPFDLIYDCIGTHSLFVASPAFLKPQGPYISIAIDIPHESSWLHAAYLFAELAGDMMWPSWLGGTPRRFVLSPTPIERFRIEDPVRWAAEGRLKVLLDSVHASNREGVLAGYERSMSGHAKGKILFNMEEF